MYIHIFSQLPSIAHIYTFEPTACHPDIYIYVVRRLPWMRILAAAPL
jgi:hypothetical protein